jgi:hypothetical protein
MKRYVLVLLVVVFSGCYQDRDFGIFQRDAIYKKAIKNTQKGDILNSFETKALIIATYLNPVLDGYQEDENFFVGVYSSVTKDNLALDDRDYSLLLDGSKANKIVEIEDNESIKTKMPFVNEWFRYYIVTFNSSEKESLNLTFSHKEFGNTELHFVK